MDVGEEGNGKYERKECDQCLDQFFPIRSLKHIVASVTVVIFIIPAGKLECNLQKFLSESRKDFSPQMIDGIIS